MWFPRRRSSFKFICCLLATISMLWGFYVTSFLSTDPGFDDVSFLLAENNHGKKLQFVPRLQAVPRLQTVSMLQPLNNHYDNLPNVFEIEERAEDLRNYTRRRHEIKKVKLEEKSRTQSAEEDVIRQLGELHNKKEEMEREKGYKNHAFNELVSDRIGNYRSIPDTRDNACQSVQHSDALPTASVVICFHNEAQSALLRTVHSILNRSPDYLIEEIVLIDDSSTFDDLQQPLSDYIELNLPKVKLHRNGKREGLIRSRVLGAKQATGDILVFIDSHCEVNVGWLESLISPIHADHTRVVCPIIDIINSDTFEYTSSPRVRGGFNWGLHFSWEKVPPGDPSNSDPTALIKSPTMAGGLFAMNRKFFYQLGAYDEGMEIWGGENLEISFRIWMCGGSLYIAPCSRVGHVFRRRRPYGSPSGKDTFIDNTLRVAHVWLDNYRSYYFKARPNLANRTDYGDISARLELRRKLDCHSFDWYLTNVYPEHALPSAQRAGQGGDGRGDLAAKIQQGRQAKLLAVGQLKNVRHGMCLSSEQGSYQKGSKVIVVECNSPNKTNPQQLWYHTVDGEFLVDNILCLEVPVLNGDMAVYPRIMKCNERGTSQKWGFNMKAESSQLYQTSTGHCLHLHKNVLVGYMVRNTLCVDIDEQRWSLIPFEPPDQLQ